MTLHTANLRELNTLSHIESEPAPLRSDVEADCRAVASILQEMPQSEEEFLVAFAANRVGQHPVSAYAGYAQRAKHADVVSFAAKLADRRI